MIEQLNVPASASASVHETYTAQPPFSNSLTVSVQQPDGTLLSDQVTIH